ncbi:hypothetical protein ABZZ79_39270 [Streptomyces sp. NPDC006458]|uniref:hypothetical protein n=1 Tax=Streptomyces sp. NPDC006458 TaxID=3154302 RepID=UPI0033B7E2CE
MAGGQAGRQPQEQARALAVIEGQHQMLLTVTGAERDPGGFLTVRGTLANQGTQTLEVPAGLRGNESEVLRNYLRAKVYSFLARQAIWTGDPDTRLTYAEKGLVRSDRLTPTIQAMLHSARARAFGKMGDIGATMAAVGAADDAFAKPDPHGDPPWMAYYDKAQHHGDTGHALYALVLRKDQDPGQANRRFEIAIDGHGDAYARSRAISGTKLARLLMVKGDPRPAAVVPETPEVWRCAGVFPAHRQP